MTEKTLQNRTRMDEIRPARGVKLKPRETVQKPEVKRDPPQIIQNVPTNGVDVPPPTEEAMRLIAKASASKDDLFAMMVEFNSLLKIRTLSDNKTEEEKKKENDIVARLARAALSVDDLSPKEGLLSLCILAIRQALSLRDAGNEIAYRIVQMENRMKKIEEKMETISSGGSVSKEVVDTKKQMLEMSDMLRKLAQGGNNG